MNSRLRIIVMGYIVRGPLGGLTWHHLQYVLGLARLGHDVYFLEDSDDYESCYDPTKHIVSADPTYGINYIKNVFDRFGIGERWGYYDIHTSKWFGPCSKNIKEICDSADLLINISEVNTLRSWFLDIPVRAMIDTDPAFNQIRHLNDQKMRENLKKHNVCFTFGENINEADCSIPDDGFKWLPTHQPIVLSEWPVTVPPIRGKFTTIMQWDSYPPVEHAGVSYGLKSETFEKYLDIPMKTKQTLELALGTKEAPRELLRENGWKIEDPLKISETPWTYQDYIQKSKAEFGIAKHGYVISNSGWFSERSACYLASGRPGVVQDTGFSKWMEVGEGVLAFRNSAEAIAAIEEVNHRYDFHCRKAREIAEEYFDSREVLSEFLHQAMDSGKNNIPGESVKISDR